jgi:hypothetical protein
VTRSFGPTLAEGSVSSGLTVTAATVETVTETVGETAENSWPASSA